MSYFSYESCSKLMKIKEIFADDSRKNDSSDELHVCCICLPLFWAHNHQFYLWWKINAVFQMVPCKGRTKITAPVHPVNNAFLIMSCLKTWFYNDVKLHKFVNWTPNLSSYIFLTVKIHIILPHKDSQQASASYQLQDHKK